MARRPPHSVAGERFTAKGAVMLENSLPFDVQVLVYAHDAGFGDGGLQRLCGKPGPRVADLSEIV